RHAKFLRQISRQDTGRRAGWQVLGRFGEVDWVLYDENSQILSLRCEAFPRGREPIEGGGWGWQIPVINQWVTEGLAIIRRAGIIYMWRRGLKQICRNPADMRRAVWVRRVL